MYFLHISGSLLLFFSYATCPFSSKYDIHEVRIENKGGGGGWNILPRSHQIVISTLPPFRNSSPFSVVMVNCNTWHLPYITAFFRFRIPIESTLLEVGASGPDRHFGWNFPDNPFDHGKVLVATVRVEHHETQGQLEDNTTHWPDVTGLVPTWQGEYISFNLCICIHLILNT